MALSPGRRREGHRHRQRWWRRKVSLNKNSKDAKTTGDEKDWFHLLLEIERRFRAEERKKLRPECEILPKLIKKPSADD